MKKFLMGFLFALIMMLIFLVVIAICAFIYLLGGFWGLAIFCSLCGIMGIIAATSKDSGEDIWG